MKAPKSHERSIRSLWARPSGFALGFAILAVCALGASHVRGPASGGLPSYVKPERLREPRRDERVMSPARFKSIFSRIRGSKGIRGERQELRVTVTKERVEQLRADLAGLLGESAMDLRDKDPAQTNSYYFAAFEAFTQNGLDAYKAAIRVRDYLDKDGLPINKIVADETGDHWVKFEIKLPKMIPGRLDRRRDNIIKSTVIMREQDVRDLLGGERSFRESRDRIAQFLKEEVRKKGALLNQPKVVDDVLACLADMYAEKLAIENPLFNIKYFRRAWVMEFQYDERLFALLTEAKALEQKARDAYSDYFLNRMTDPSKRAEGERAGWQAQEIYEELSSGRAHASLGEPVAENLKSFKVDLTVDEKIQTTNLVTGSSALSQPDHRVVELKTPLHIADLTDAELAWIGASKYVQARALYLGLEKVPGSKKGTGKVLNGGKEIRRKEEWKSGGQAFD